MKKIENKNGITIEFEDSDSLIEQKLMSHSISVAWNILILRKEKED